ncbi:MAG: choice-of-anchor J domain-containing protein [Chitinophagaceae bacterium]|nr:choice-of-anchor J domain-containing protein [Chitinophagaceae bacterium]
MKKIQLLLLVLFGFSMTTGIIVSCKKDELKTVKTPSPYPPPPPGNPSFTEEFNNVGDLTAKGWVFKNNSQPVGATGWRQGRYEPSASKFPVPYIGFQAYSSSTTPNDFVSCDGSCVNDIGEISAWLISPALLMKNGDKITFYTRALDDAAFIFYTKDRVQVLANFTNGSSDVGQIATTTGSFTKVLLDINPAYAENAISGYPEVWTKYTITISGLAAPVSNARFAFRYFGTDAGASSNATNTSSVVGIDQLVFTSN